MPNIKWQLRRKDPCCGEEKATAVERSVLRRSKFRAGGGERRAWIKDQAEQGERSMASHQIETVFFLVAVVVVSAIAAALYTLAGVCRMTLDLQERVAVRGTPVVVRVKFGKCRLK